MKRIISTIVAFAVTVIIFSSPWGNNYAQGVEAEEFNETVEYTSDEAARSAISSGTYYISNVQFDKVVQIDDNVSPSTSGRSLSFGTMIREQISSGKYHVFTMDIFISVRLQVIWQ